MAYARELQEKFRRDRARRRERRFGQLIAERDAKWAEFIGDDHVPDTIDPPPAVEGEE